MSLPGSLWVLCPNYLGLGSVLGEVPHDGILVHAELDLAIDLDEDGTVFDLIHGAIDTTGGDDFVSLLELVTELLKFFLLFALRPDHEKPHDSEQQDHHDQKTGTARTGSLSRTCGLQ